MASQLKVDTIKGVTTAGSIAVTGEGNSTTTNLQQGLGKSWIYLKGNDTFGIQDSHNTASATDNGEGDYTSARTSAFSNDDYATSALCSATTGGNPHYNFTVENQDTRVRSTTSLRIYILNSQSGQGANDAIDSSITFFGDLA